MSQKTAGWNNKTSGDFMKKNVSETHGSKRI